MNERLLWPLPIDKEFGTYPRAFFGHPEGTSQGGVAPEGCAWEVPKKAQGVYQTPSWGRGRPKNIISWKSKFSSRDDQNLGTLLGMSQTHGTPQGVSPRKLDYTQEAPSARFPLGLLCDQAAQAEVSWFFRESSKAGSRAAALSSSSKGSKMKHSIDDLMGADITNMPYINLIKYEKSQHLSPCTGCSPQVLRFGPISLSQNVIPAPFAQLFLVAHL